MLLERTVRGAITHTWRHDAVSADSLVEKLLRRSVPVHRRHANETRRDIRTTLLYCLSSPCNAGLFRSTDSRRHIRRCLRDAASCDSVNHFPALSLRMVIVYPVTGCSTLSGGHGDVRYGSISDASS